MDAGRSSRARRSTLDLDGTLSFTEELQPPRPRRVDPGRRRRARCRRRRPSRTPSGSPSAPRSSTSSGSAWPMASPCCSSRCSCRRGALPGPPGERPGARVAVRAADATATATRVVRAREALEPIALPAREAQLLGVEPHRPALLIEGLAFDRGRPAGGVRALIRPGRPDALLRGAGRRPLRPRSDSAATGSADPSRKAVSRNADAADRRRSGARPGGADASDPSDRAFAVVGVLAIVVAACGGTTTTAAPSAGASHRARAGESTAPEPPLGGGARPGRDPLVLLPRRRRRARAGRGREEGRRGVQRQPPEHQARRSRRSPTRAPTTRSPPRSPRATARTSWDRSASAARTRSTASGSTSRPSSRRPATT